MIAKIINRKWEKLYDLVLAEIETKVTDAHFNRKKFKLSLTFKDTKNKYIIKKKGAKLSYVLCCDSKHSARIDDIINEHKLLKKVISKHIVLEYTNCLALQSADAVFENELNKY